MTDWERADAVIDRLWHRWPEGILDMERTRGYVRVTAWAREDAGRVGVGTGPTVVAALLDLGTKLEEVHAGHE